MMAESLTIWDNGCVVPQSSLAPPEPSRYGLQLVFSDVKICWDQEPLVYRSDTTLSFRERDNRIESWPWIHLRDYNNSRITCAKKSKRQCTWKEQSYENRCWVAWNKNCCRRNLETYNLLIIGILINSKSCGSHLCWKVVSFEKDM